MNVSIVDAIQAQLTPTEVNRVAEQTGETPSKARHAMSSGIVAIVSSLIQRTSSPGGASSVFAALQTPAYGGDLAARLLGDRGEHVADVVERTSGVSRSASAGIVAALLPMVAGFLGRQVTGRNLDVRGLADMLASQKRGLYDHTAGRLGGLDRDDTAYASVTTSRVIPVAGPEPTAPVGPPFVDAERSEPRYVEPRPVEPRYVEPRPVEPRPVEPRYVEPRYVEPPSSAGERVPVRSWLPLAWIAAVFALGALLLLWAARPRSSQPQLQGEAPIAPPPAAEGPRAPAAPESGETTVTGARVEPRTSDDLARHFGPSATADRMTLGGIDFDVGTSDVTETRSTEGTSTIDELTIQLKNHPAVHVRIEGHTDNTGNPATNQSLSQKRAEAVRRMLIDRGIDGSRIDAVGKRDLEPVATNDTAEGRAKNRRIDAVITKR